VSHVGSNQGLVDEIRQAYDGSAAAWATGPTLLYRRLARALVAASPWPLTDHRVLDLGTGTGVASDVLTEAGARPIGLDLALSMVRHRQAERPPGAVGDAQALPFGNGTFDAVLAAFILNHLPDPARGLAECRRVTRSGGLVLASTFPTDADHPAKAVVEGILERYGYERPSWYRTFKERIAGLTGDADAFTQAAVDAGLDDIEVLRVEVAAGLDQPELAVEWRLNMPHTIGFVGALGPEARTTLRRGAIEALSDDVSSDLPSAVPILILRARVR
jgi:ubiquinone/menaquinone biosynthesis C-methylase UbiE